MALLDCVPKPFPTDEANTSKAELKALRTEGCCSMNLMLLGL
jgi:hypothetical protein